MAQGFLLKYAEIGVKGKNRYKFEDALCDQIRLRLSCIDGDFTVQKESGRVFVQADGDFDFDEVIARNATYKEHEAKAKEKHLCRLGGGAMNG